MKPGQHYLRRISRKMRPLCSAWKSRDRRMVVIGIVIAVVLLALRSFKASPPGVAISGLGSLAPELQGSSDPKRESTDGDTWMRAPARWGEWLGLGPEDQTTKHARLELIGRIQTFRDRYTEDWPIDKWRAAREYTCDALDALLVCLASRTCRTNQTKVVIGGSFHFGNSQTGHVSGEDIWARSSVDAFHVLGYTVLYAYKPLEVLAMHQSFGEHIIAAFMESGDINDCLRSGVPKPLNPREASNHKQFHVVSSDQEVRRLSDLHSLGIKVGVGSEQVYGWKMLEGPGSNSDEMWGDFRCIKREGFEEGLPLWKLFAFHFWSDAVHPLGANWTLSPEKYEKNTFLGYSIESYCKRKRFVSQEEREDRAFVFGKQGHYFMGEDCAFNENNRTFADIQADTHIQFTAASGAPGSWLPDDGLLNVGVLSMDDFYEHLAASKLLIGLGRPLLSPTPYDALCLGVPFVNPISGWNKTNPDAREHWYTQHEGMKYLEEPYVYHVRKNDKEGLKRAIEAARVRPIERYIPAHMTAEATAARHADLLNGNWLALAGETVERNQNANAFLKTVIL